jgi:cellulose synthase/poly-beta-1,6-N-acetylglucosamine synthase-like glycosyltransferase
MPWTFWVDSVFLWYFGIINGFYTFVLILGMVRTYFRQKDLKIEDFSRVLRSESLPEICFLIPMYNEAASITRTLQSICHLTYRYKAVIAINDGSSDETMEVLKRDFALLPIPLFYAQPLSTAEVLGVYRSKTHPEIVVIDKAHRGKFDALNAGLNACSHSFFIVADADSFIDDRCFETLIRPLMADTETIAIGATIRIRNGCTLQFNRIDTRGFPDRYLSGMQGTEYLRSFLMRQGWDWVGGNFLIAGAFSVFSTAVIQQLGGFSDNVGEDVEIILRIHRAMKESQLPYKIVYLPDPVSWTEGPSTFKSLGAQRTRWHFGLLQAIWAHKRAYCRPRYGLFGFVIYPFMIWGEALEPLIEGLGYLYIAITFYLGLLNIPFFVLFLFLSFGFTFFYSVICLLIEELSFKTYSSWRSLSLLLASCLVENIGYRQLNLFWKLRGFIRFFKEFPKVRRESRRIDQLVKDFKENCTGSDVIS